MIHELSDEEARRALVCKWGEVDDDVLPAWVAEMDYATPPVVVDAVQAAVADGMLGYPRFEPGGPLGEAFAGFAARRYGHTVEPAMVRPVVDVTAGVRLVLDVLAPPGPLVLPLPAYAPQLDLAAITGRERVDLVLDPDAERAELDLDRLDALFAAGARTLLLTQPHNPWGRSFTDTELEGLRDVVLRHDAFVVCDEIMAPLALDGPARSFLHVEGVADHAAAVVSASKAFNVAGLKCAQVVVADSGQRRALVEVPPARNDSWSPLGVVAATAAYTHGDQWLDALLQRLREQRDLLAALLAEHLPRARMRPLEATYLAWIDLRAYGHDDPAAVALERSRVRLAPGSDYHPGLPGHVRINFATSEDRLTEIVRRLAKAITDPPS